MSHCISHKVSCILVKDGRIISTGYNETAAGFHNCDEINCKIQEKYLIKN
jgi:dCMP deaminase